MKKFAILLMSILMIVCSVAITGCGIQPNSENSYIISIYEKKYTQEESGIVIFNGYNLKKSFQVIKTQMYELDYELDEKAGEKYHYEGIYTNDKIIENKKIQVFPGSDATIYLREREKKDIKIYYNGEYVYNKLNPTLKKEYEEKLLGKYNENFHLDYSVVGQIINNQGEDFILEMYTNKEFTGKPFATGEFYYNRTELRGSINFNLIETTDVYVRVRNA